jgi:hypothetical protein
VKDGKISDQPAALRWTVSQSWCRGDSRGTGGSTTLFQTTLYFRQETWKMKKAKIVIYVLLAVAGFLTILMAPPQFFGLGLLAVISSVLVEHCWLTDKVA